MPPGPNRLVPFRLEVSATTWARIGSLDREEFERCNAVLDVLAAGLALDEWGPRSSAQLRSGQTWHEPLPGLTVTYRYDQVARSVEVMDLLIAAGESAP